MRVIVLGTRGFPNVQGGVEIHCQNLCPALARLGCEVIVFTRKPYIDSAINEYQGVKLVAIPTVKNKHLEAFLHTFLGVLKARRYKPDVVHIQAIGPSFFAPLAKILGMRVIMTSHGSNYKHLKWGRFPKLFLRFSEFVGVTFSNKVITITNSIAQEIKNKYKVDATVIPNGVVLPQISETDETLAQFGLEKGKYILTVGRFVPEKGFHDLMEAFKITKIDWKLVIAGKADHEDKYSRELKELAEKSKDIILAGFVTGKPLQELYSCAGLFVLPSYYEGLPIALLEAMSYGLSCLVSDIPANRQFGLAEKRFFKAGDRAGLARKIREFVDEPLGEEEKSRQSNFITQGYDWNRVAAETLALYKESIR